MDLLRAEPVFGAFLKSKQTTYDTSTLENITRNSVTYETGFLFCLVHKKNPYMLIANTRVSCVDLYLVYFISQTVLHAVLKSAKRARQQKICVTILCYYFCYCYAQLEDMVLIFLFCVF